MVKKRGITVNAGSSGEADAMRKLSKKELGRAVSGSPDEWDAKNIQILLDTYEKAFPGRIKRMAMDYRVEAALTTRNKFGIVAAESDTRITLWLPEDLQQVLEASYPSIWTNKKHLLWFLKHFPVFKAAEVI